MRYFSPNVPVLPPASRHISEHSGPRRLLATVATLATLAWAAAVTAADQPAPVPIAPVAPGDSGGAVTLTQMEIPVPLLRPGAVFQSQHMTVVRYRVLPPEAGVEVIFSLTEKIDPQKPRTPGVRPAMLTHRTARTDAAGIARTWLVAGEQEGTVTLKAVSTLGAASSKTKTVEISRTGLSRILVAAPDLPTPPPDTPAPTPEAAAQAQRQIAELDRADQLTRDRLRAELTARAAAIRPALQLAVTDTGLSDDTRRWCAKLLLGAPTQPMPIDFVAVLRDDRPAVQEAALTALERSAVATIRPLQEQLAQSVDPADRALAVRLAGYLDEATLEQQVSRALEDPDPLVVALALQFAGRYLDPAMRRHAAQYIFDARPLVAWTALQWIEETAARRAAIPFSERAGHDRTHPLTIRLETLQAIRALAGAEYAAFRDRALRVLPRLQGITADQWLETLMAGRWTDAELPLLLDGLGEAADPPRDFLLKLAQQPEAQLAIRDAAALACVHATPPADIATLFRWFGHANESVRIAAYERFMQLTAHDFGALPEAQGRIIEFWREHGRQSPAEWMIHSIRSKDPLRAIAARELTGLVRQHTLTAERALTALQTMVDDADPGAQTTALIAIAHLDPDGEHTAAKSLRQAVHTVLNNPEDIRALPVLGALATVLQPGGLTTAAQQRLKLWEPVVAALGHRSHAARAAAFDLLVGLSGLDYGFDPVASADRIATTQAQYREWFSRNWK